MTRVEKNKKVYKKNKKSGKKVIKILKFIIKNMIAFVVGILYMLYVTIRAVNNAVAKLFMKLPRIAKITVVYSLIAVAIYGQVNVRTEIKEVIKQDELKITVDKSQLQNTDVEVQETASTTQNSNLSTIERQIYEKALEVGLNEQQAYIVVSISKHETGNWTSSAFRNKNNLGGVMCNSGLKTYSSFEDGLNGFVNLLKKHYFDKGLNTIEQIGAKYCPVGASNDPTGVNQYWVPNVTKYFNEYIGG